MEKSGSVGWVGGLVEWCGVVWCPPAFLSGWPARERGPCTRTVTGMKYFLTFIRFLKEFLKVENSQFGWSRDYWWKKKGEESQEPNSGIYIYIYTYVLLLLVWYGCCEKRVQDSNGCVCQVALFFWWAVLRKWVDPWDDGMLNHRWEDVSLCAVCACVYTDQA